MKEFAFMFVLFIGIKLVFAQTNVNYDESKVPEYNLPKLLVSQDGEKIRTAKQWIDLRKPEIVNLFCTYILSSWRLGCEKSI
jgi:hypothetical protein